MFGRALCLDLKGDPQVIHIHEELYAVAQQSFEASWVRLLYAVFSRLPLHGDAGAAAGSQNVAEAARAEATACVKQLQVVLTVAFAACSQAML